jgi:uncharacterized protein YceH (UPF0502 family)
MSPAEIRVLGSLIEKETTTPEYYPLTLNALVAACNQKSNRWPVTELTDNDTLATLDSLRARGYAAAIMSGGRVTKYAQRFVEKLNLGRRETAILCVLMLRGAQTPGEIRGRTGRLYEFTDLEETETVLQKMMDRPEGALVQRLAPAPGMKEARFAQTLGGPVEAHALAQAAAPRENSPDRMSALEAEVARLREEVAELRRRLEEVL